MMRCPCIHNSQKLILLECEANLFHTLGGETFTHCSTTRSSLRLCLRSQLSFSAHLNSLSFNQCCQPMTRKPKTLFLHVTHFNNPGIVMDCEPDELITIFLDLFCFIVRACSFKMKHFTTISWLDATKNKNSPSQCLFLIC